MRNIYSALLRKYPIIFIAGSVRFSNATILSNLFCIFITRLTYSYVSTICISLKRDNILTRRDDYSQKEDATQIWSFQGGLLECQVGYALYRVVHTRNGRTFLLCVRARYTLYPPKDHLVSPSSNPGDHYPASFSQQKLLRVSKKLCERPVRFRSSSFVAAEDTRKLFHSTVQRSPSAPIFSNPPVLKLCLASSSSDFYRCSTMISRSTESV